jgi:glycosyltransferase involved in cell wall biosynthesis
MIEALRRIPEYRYTIFTTVDNHEYDHLGLPVKRLPSVLYACWSALGRTLNIGAVPELFREVDKLIAPIYTPYLLGSGRPFAFTLHDLQEKYYPQNFSFATRAWRHVTNRLLTRRATRILCESRYVRLDIMKFFRVDPARICIIPAPPILAFRDVPLSPAQLALARDRLQLPEQYLFYPAQFFPHKNHLRLIEAFAEVSRSEPALHLVLTGEPRFEYAHVMRRVQQLDLAQRVRHVGQVPMADLPALYQMASVVVIPTLFESISIPIYEAFALGVPVCAANIGALPEQVGNAARLFDPLSPADIARVIRDVTNNAASRRELAARGRQLIETLTADSYAQRLQELLSQVA